MKTYLITEKQNESSYRESERFNASSLTSAKRQASRWQFFKGTVMTIQDESGNVISVKRGDKWEDK